MSLEQLYIRYPNNPWTLFDDANASTYHQKKGLEMLIESGQDSLHVSIPHLDGGQFIAEYEKIINKNHETGKDIILYYYFNDTLQTVEMMYADPIYIAYINRLTT